MEEQELPQLWPLEALEGPWPGQGVVPTSQESQEFSAHHSSPALPSFPEFCGRREGCGWCVTAGNPIRKGKSLFLFSSCLPGGVEVVEGQGRAKDGELSWDICVSEQEENPARLN